MRSALPAAVFAIALFAGFAEARNLKAGADTTYEPHTVLRLGGETDGFSVDLMKLISRRMNAEIRIVNAQYAHLPEGLEAGEYDLLIPPMEITGEAAERLLFSEGYLSTDYLFAVRRDTPEIYRLQGFAGKIIAASEGTVHERWLRGLADEMGWTVVTYRSDIAALQAVIAGAAFASVGQEPGMAWAIRKWPQLRLGHRYFTGSVLGIAFPKEGHGLRARVETVLECLKLDGSLAELHERWFGYPPQPGAATMIPRVGFGEPGFSGFDGRPHEFKCD